MSDRDGDAAGSCRYVCDACSEWCELLTEGWRKPKRCPYHNDENTEWEYLEEDEEEEQEQDE